MMALNGFVVDQDLSQAGHACAALVSDPLFGFCGSQSQHPQPSQHFSQLQILPEEPVEMFPILPEIPAEPSGVVPAPVGNQRKRKRTDLRGKISPATAASLAKEYGVELPGSAVM